MNIKSYLVYIVLLLDIHENQRRIPIEFPKYRKSFFFLETILYSFSNFLLVDEDLRD